MLRKNYIKKYLNWESEKLVIIIKTRLDFEYIPVRYVWDYRENRLCHCSPQIIKKQSSVGRTGIPRKIDAKLGQKWKFGLEARLKPLNAMFWNRLVGSNPVLSAKRRLAFVSQNKRNAYACVPFYFAFFCFVAWSSTTGQFELCIGRVAPSPCFARTNPVFFYQTAHKGASSAIFACLVWSFTFNSRHTRP